MNGKSKCKILKDIRRQIARDNDIEYVTSECKYQGECSGTCPKCEAEVRYLEEELRKRQRAGKAVAVAGIAASLVIGATGCASLGLGTSGGKPIRDPNYSQEEQVPGAIGTLAGDIYIPSETEENEVTFMGAMVAPTDSTVEALMGDIAEPTTLPIEEEMGEVAEPME